MFDLESIRPYRACIGRRDPFTGLGCKLRKGNSTWKSANLTLNLYLLPFDLLPPVGDSSRHLNQ